MPTALFAAFVTIEWIQGLFLYEAIQMIEYSQSKFS